MMAPVKKSEKLVHRAVITSDPRKAVTEYFRSKAEERRPKKYPEWDVARIGPAAELVKSLRELSAAEIELEAKKLDKETKRNILDQQWAELRHNEELLRQSFIKFNKFVKENNDKRERAQIKIAEEKERRVKCQEQIEELSKQLEYTVNVRDKMQEHVDRYKLYQNYLEKVVNETGEFQNIGEIFDRYESLVEARIVLARHQDKNLEALEDTGVEMARMTEEKGQMLGDLNNKLMSLQSRYERAKAQALEWETIVGKIKAGAAAKNLELSQVKSSCWNMYRQLCRRKGFPIEVDRDDVENQLSHIKRTILELKRIARLAKRRTAWIPAFCDKNEDPGEKYRKDRRARSTMNVTGSVSA